MFMSSYDTPNYNRLNPFEAASLGTLNDTTTQLKLLSPLDIRLPKFWGGGLIVQAPLS